jgi:hypothetical protein
MLDSDRIACAMLNTILTTQFRIPNSAFIIQTSMLAYHFSNIRGVFELLDQIV